MTISRRDAIICRVRRWRPCLWAQSRRSPAGPGFIATGAVAGPARGTPSSRWLSRAASAERGWFGSGTPRGLRGPISDPLMWRTQNRQAPEIEFDYAKMQVKVDTRGLAKLTGTMHFSDLQRLPRVSHTFLMQCGAANPRGVAVSASSEVLPQFREYERCSTTVIDAYLSPLLGRYLRRLAQATGERGLPEPAVMLSSGGVAPAEEAAGAGAWSVLSGPAGGAIGAGVIARLGRQRAGLRYGRHRRCDVCVIEDGRVRRTDSREIGGRVIQLPMSTSTRLVLAAARSPGATPAAPCESGRARQEADPGPPVTGAAAPSQRSPTPISRSATSAPSRASRAVSSSTAAQRKWRSPGSRRNWASSCSRPPRGSSASLTRRWCERCASSRWNAASIRAVSR